MERTYSKLGGDSRNRREIEFIQGKFITFSRAFGWVSMPSEPKAVEKVDELSFCELYFSPISEILT